MAGRDQQDQKLWLNFNRERCVWELTKTETELWKEPEDPVLEKIKELVTDENGNTLSEEEIASLGTVSVVKTPEDVTPGHYTIKAQVENANKNYDITCGDTTFDILARPITIKTMNMVIEYGDDVPDVDYYIYDMNGELADPAIVSGTDFPSLDFSIEGQDEGKHLAASTTPYAINVSGLDNGQDTGDH